jgi:hypothetical protein
MILGDLPREPRVGDKVRYNDGLIGVEHEIAGVDYECGEGVKFWLTRSETDERGVLSGMQSSWIDRRTLKKWLRLKRVSYLMEFEE